MKILVINSGSSSMKYQLIDYHTKTVLAKGIAERIGISNPLFSYKRNGEDGFKKEMEIKTHKDAVMAMIEALTHAEYGVIQSLNEIKAIGHRVLHGAEFFKAPVVIDDEVKRVIRKCFAWGPLHNPANLMGIEVCEELLAGIPQVAIFDTAFHQTMPPKAYRYAIPERYYTELGIRRYGFHGTSHAYVARRTAEFLGVDVQKGFRLVTCHLGNGSSFSAVQDGACVDTTMGLTPLSGIAMGTRSGDIDPAIIPYIQKAEGLSPDEMDSILNKQSGMLALSGKSSDFRDLQDGAEAGDERCRLALDVFTYQASKIIASYAAAMGGIDAVAFTGGIGENDWQVREAVCRPLGFMGISIDEALNKTVRGTETILSQGGPVTVLVMPTNEELSICEQTVELLGLHQ